MSEAKQDPGTGTAVEETAEAAEFAELEDQSQSGPEAPLSSLYDLTMPISIELGRTKMSVQELLTLGRGSIIHLDRLAGEPMDVYVGDRRFAEGEVVVIGEQFGIRITRIVAQESRADAA
jgi:flagellar motor switch protein FliN/FliY